MLLNFEIDTEFDSSALLASAPELLLELNAFDFVLDLVAGDNIEGVESEKFDEGNEALCDGLLRLLLVQFVNFVKDVLQCGVVELIEGD